MDMQMAFSQALDTLGRLGSRKGPWPEFSGDTGCPSDIFRKMCKAAKTPYSVKLLEAFEVDHMKLLDVKCDPKAYSDQDRDEFQVDWLLWNFIRKNEALRTLIDKKRVALRGFAASEDQCRITNNLFRDRSEGRVNFTPRVERALLLARHKIANLLEGVEGGVNPLSTYNWASNCRFGPGTTREGMLSLSEKQRATDVSPRARRWASALLSSDHVWFRDLTGLETWGPFSVLGRNLFTEASPDKLTTVPKDATKDRCIAIAPALHVYMQLGVAGYLRERLRTVGIDLNSQLHNQEAARRACVDGLATLDLSSASDTVSWWVVAELLPPRWLELLDDLRSHYYSEPGGTSVAYEKFSAMGCGFTFELETLIFWALSSAVDSQQRVLVYGDDIIVSQGAARDVIEVLEAVGFTVNSAKSFTSGPFYESCGKHYFGGFDVTPLYQEEALGTSGSYYRAANRLLRYAVRHSGSSGRACTVALAGWLTLLRSFKSMPHVMPLARSWRRYVSLGEHTLARMIEFYSTPDTYMEQLYEGDTGIALPRDLLLNLPDKLTGARWKRNKLECTGVFMLLHKRFRLLGAHYVATIRRIHAREGAILTDTDLTFDWSKRDIETVRRNSVEVVRTFAFREGIDNVHV